MEPELWRFWIHVQQQVIHQHGVLPLVIPCFLMFAQQLAYSVGFCCADVVLWRYCTNVQQELIDILLPTNFRNRSLHLLSLGCLVVVTSNFTVRGKHCTYNV